jgi:dephospho-CoA kinase
MIIGLTGRVGTGKSRAASLLSKTFPIQLIDLDIIGHDILEDPDIIKKLVTEFGDVIIEGKKINRFKLSQIVFSFKQYLNKLNIIMHPPIKAITQNLIKSHKKPIVIVGALIQEIGLTSNCKTIVITDAEDDQIRKEIGSKFNIARFQRSQDNYLKEGSYILKNNFDKQFDDNCVSLFKKLLATQS